MPKVILSPWLAQIHGTIGDVVFRRSPTGETIISRRPDMSKVKWSQAQQEHRQRFKRAVAYARAAMADPDVREVYEEMAAKKRKRLFDMAVSDYMKGNDLLSKK